MLLEYIYLASGLNFSFLAIVLYRRNTQNVKSTQILIRLLLCLALYSSVVFLHYKAVESNAVSVLSYYLPIDGILLAIITLNLYLFVMAALQVSVNRSPKMLFLHSLAFIPFIAFNLYFVTLNRTERIDWLMRDFHTGTTENNLLNAVLYVKILVYIVVSYSKVTKKIKQSCDNTSTFDTPNLNWLRNYLLINVIYTLISIPFCFYFANERTNIIIGQLAMSIQFVYLFFRITSNADVPSPIIQKEIVTNLNMLKFNQDEVDAQLTKLSKYMNDIKPYLNEACSIQTVSEYIEIPPHRLSNILNCKLQKTFPEYINEYRIIAAQQILLSAKTDSITIESIAFECGFGSKSAFNRSFKKFSQNLTPSEFVCKYQKL